MLAAHKQELSINPGLPGPRDRDLLESAIARPYTGYYRSIHRKAAALAMILLLHRSGYVLQPRERRPGTRIDRLNDEVVEMVLAVAESRLSFEDLVQWFKDRVTSADDRNRYFL